MKIVEYTLRTGQQTDDLSGWSEGKGAKWKHCPDEIINGGHWINPDDDSMIGFVEDDSVPESVTVLTSAEFETRQLNIHSNYPMKKELGSWIVLEDVNDPVATTNADGVGVLFRNTISGELFQCSDATENANVWVKKTYNQVPGEVGDPHGTLLPTVKYPPLSESNAVEMTEVEIRHLLQYWVTQNI